MTRRPVLLSILSSSVAVAAVIVLAPVDADACLIAGSPPFLVEEEVGAESVEIAAPVVGTPSILRARNVTEPPVGCSVDSCADLTQISVPVTAPEGFAAEELGYVVERTGGDAPSGFKLPSGPVSGERIIIVFSERIGESTLLDVELSIRAINRAGNLGEPATVRITDPDSLGGCGASTGRATALAVPLLLVLAMRRMRPGSRPA